MNLVEHLREKAEARATVLSGLSSSYKREESKRKDSSQAQQRKKELDVASNSLKSVQQHRTVNRTQSTGTDDSTHGQHQKVDHTANKSASKVVHQGNSHLSAKSSGSSSSAIPTSSSSTNNSNVKRGRASNGCSDISTNIVFDFVNRHHIQQSPGFVNSERVREYLREQLQSKAIILENNRPLLSPTASSLATVHIRVSKRKMESLGVSFEPPVPNNKQLQVMEQQWTTYYRRLTNNCDSLMQQISRLSHIALVGAKVTAHMFNESEKSVEGTILSVTPQDYFICRQISTHGNENQSREVVKIARQKCELSCVQLPKKKRDSGNNSESSEAKVLVIHCDEQLAYQDKQRKQHDRGRKRRRKN